MQIRPFCPEDSDQLARLFFRTIHEINIRDYSEEQVAAWAPADRDLKYWGERFKGRITFVAEDESGLVGFGELEPNGHIDRFYVSAERIGQGVGKKIYKKLEDEARRLGLNHLFVEASITAKPFFEGLGFSLIRSQTVNVRGVELQNFVMEKVWKL